MVKNVIRLLLPSDGRHRSAPIRGFKVVFIRCPVGPWLDCRVPSCPVGAASCLGIVVISWGFGQLAHQAWDGPCCPS